MNMIRRFLEKAGRIFWFLPGFLLWAAFPPVGETADVFFALAPLLWFARNRTPKSAFRLWFLNGLFFWIATLSWMPAIIKNGGPWPLVVLGWGALSAYCALYFGAFGFFSARFWAFARERSFAWRAWGLLVVEPFLWAGLELVRSRLFGGFAWNQLGVAPVNASLGAPAVLGGVFLVSAAVVLVNGTLASVAERMMARETGARRWLRSLETLVPFALILSLWSVSGGIVEKRAAAEGWKTVSAGLIQRNFPCAFSAQAENPVETYDMLADRIAPFKPDLTVLPESALAEFGPADGANAAGFMRYLAKRTGSRAVISGGTPGTDGAIYNSAVLHSGDGPLQRYDKVHLVPFGEYIPFDKTFPSLQKLAPVGSCTAGEPKLLDFEGMAAGAAICFEDTDSSLVSRFARMGAGLLVFITNDSWFSSSIEPVQHAWQAVARAIETGLPVLRVGNSGVTGAIDPSGSPVWLSVSGGKPLVDACGAMCAIAQVPPEGLGPTPYVAFGDAPLAVLFVLALAFPLPFARRRIPLAAVAAALSIPCASRAAWEPLLEPGGGGAIVSVEASPLVEGLVVAGGDMLGTGVSSDGGESWKPGLGLSTYEMAAPTFHPERADEVWTGSCSGPYRSRDRGRTWEWKRAGMPEPSHGRYSAMIEKILFHPHDSSRMLAFGGSSRRWGRCDNVGGVWRSEDGGETWTLNGAITSAGFEPGVAKGCNIVKAFIDAAGRVHAVADKCGWFVSDDFGKSFRKIDVSAVCAAPEGATAHPSDPSVFWVTVPAGVPDEDGKMRPGAIFKTRDGGRTFEPSDAGIAKRRGKSRNFTTHFCDVAVSPKTPGVLLVCDKSFNGASIWKSEDGGASWRRIETWGRIPKALYAGLSMEIRASLSASGEYYAFNSEYILKSSDGGETWRDVLSAPAGEGAWRGRGWNGWCSRNVAFNPYREGQCAVQGMDACHAWISNDAFASWRYARGSVSPWCGGDSVAFAKDSRIYVATGQRGSNAGLLVSDDAGATWRTACGAKSGLPEANEGEYCFVWCDPADSSRAFAVNGTNAYFTADAGESWRARALDWQVNAVVADPSRPGWFYLKAAGEVWETRDWCSFEMLPSLGGGKWDGMVSCDARGRVIVCRGRVGDRGKRGAWRYDRASGGWERLSREPLAFICVAEPSNPDRMLLGTNDSPYHDFASGDGLFSSADGGKTWQRADEGLPMKRIYTIAFDPFAPGRAIVGTGGGGFFRNDSVFGR